jgi:arylsulfatase A-like enzyme
MNIVLVLIDSLNRHYLSAYGQSHVATPTLDAFARRAWRFDNHFVGSLPCMPARREIFAGFKEMMWRPWGPLEPFDARLPKLLEAQGYLTGLVTDHYHYWGLEAHGYLQSFQSSRLIRGHESDNWKAPIANCEPLPRWVSNIERWRPGKGRRYYGNVKAFRGEEDYFPAKVMTTAARWLEQNGHRAPFFLQVESFDVHEPFDIPEPYASMYGDGSEREKYTVWPPYQDTEMLARFMAETTTEELAFIRSQYAGKLSMVDRWLGALMNTLDERDLWDETMVIVTTDHGHDLGERGAFGKQYPDYDSHANIPMFVWHPDLPGEARGIGRLTQTVDLFPSILEAGGVTVPEHGHGRSFLSLLRGQDGGHEALLYGWFGQGACVTDAEWTLFKSPEKDGPLYYYSAAIYKSKTADSIARATGSGHFIPHVDLPQWQAPPKVQVFSRENFLFNRRKDPRQTENLWDSEPEQRERMLAILRTLMESEGVPQEQHERLGLGGP